MKKFFIVVAVLFICAGCSLSVQNTTSQFYVLDSPDDTMKVYLEKEYSPSFDRYVRQSVVLENKQTSEKTILNEIKLTSEEALARYSKDGWTANGDCVSLIDFNEFEPVKWIDNEKIEVNQYFDNYECAGKVTNAMVYNTEGEKLSEKSNLPNF